MSKKQEQPKEKLFSLTQEEKALLESQANLRSQYLYLASLIERDTFIYVNTEVRRRNAIGQDMMIDLLLAEGKIVASPKPVAPEAEKK